MGTEPKGGSYVKKETNFVPGPGAYEFTGNKKGKKLNSPGWKYAKILNQLIIGWVRAKEKL